MLWLWACLSPRPPPAAFLSSRCTRLLIYHHPSTVRQCGILKSLRLINCSTYHHSSDISVFMAFTFCDLLWFHHQSLVMMSLFKLLHQLPGEPNDANSIAVIAFSWSSVVSQSAPLLFVAIQYGTNLQHINRSRMAMHHIVENCKLGW
ncbi:uncharacterized protein M6B38_255930 [Iris pallida]|uniref:Uncharacterized protein n=1 Tax=Iris pallida TaxID=29817 RepID=A0AAX6GAM7_IRIPA|nr:uncharacterized protein M6B38_375505 [Iris pallida]KAJ6852485.1 uncharacterized protein M6B38_255930 [Iris pallida]